MQLAAHLKYGARVSQKEVPVMLERGGCCSRNLLLVAAESPETASLRLQPRVSQDTAQNPNVPVLRTPRGEAMLLPSCGAKRGSAQRSDPRLRGRHRQRRQNTKSKQQQHAPKFLNLGREEAPAQREGGCSRGEGWGEQLHPLKAFAASLRLAMIKRGQSAISSLV